MLSSYLIGQLIGLKMTVSLLLIRLVSSFHTSRQRIFDVKGVMEFCRYFVQFCVEDRTSKPFRFHPRIMYYVAVLILILACDDEGQSRRRVVVSSNKASVKTTSFVASFSKVTNVMPRYFWPKILWIHFLRSDLSWALGDIYGTGLESKKTRYGRLMFFSSKQCPYVVNRKVHRRSGERCSDGGSDGGCKGVHIKLGVCIIGLNPINNSVTFCYRRMFALLRRWKCSLQSRTYTIFRSSQTWVYWYTQYTLTSPIHSSIGRLRL